MVGRMFCSAISVAWVISVDGEGLQWGRGPEERHEVKATAAGRLQWKEPGSESAGVGQAVRSGVDMYDVSDRSTVTRSGLLRLLAAPL